jgi:hypothetical protein
MGVLTLSTHPYQPILKDAIMLKARVARSALLSRGVNAALTND